MIIVDKALEELAKQDKSVRVGLIGAGYMGKGIALQFLTPLVGMKLVAIAGRGVTSAEKAYKDAGAGNIRRITELGELEDAISQGEFAVTDSAELICKSSQIDVIIEATGEVDFGAVIALKAIENRKHVVLLNAELDATVGPILKSLADERGVVVSNSDGDEPGVAMNLYRFVKMTGYNPVLAGNIKGMIDPYRTPETQRGFAEKYNQKVRWITSFADGTKLSMETTVLANATGFKVGKRGMYGHRCKHVKDITQHFDANELLRNGLVDYALGAEPNTGAFVVGYDDHPVKKQYMNYFKMGDGPLYVFYTPYHLPHVQIASTVARAALFKDATVAPQGRPVCDVVATAKKDIKAGETLDGIGGFTCYGVIENYDVARKENLLPMGISEGCVVIRDIKKDDALTYGDVELPKNRLCDQLRSAQDRQFN